MLDNIETALENFIKNPTEENKAILESLQAEKHAAGRDPSRPSGWARRRTCSECRRETCSERGSNNCE